MIADNNDDVAASGGGDDGGGGGGVGAGQVDQAEPIDFFVFVFLLFKRKTKEEGTRKKR